MSSQLLAEFSLKPGVYGWTGKFPTGPHLLFGKEISLEIHTRLIPSEPTILPPVSQSQASLVRSIIPALPSLVRRVESELGAYNQKFDPDFQKIISHPHIWLSSENDDGASWTF